MQGLVTDQGHKIRPHGNKTSQSKLADLIYEAPGILDCLDPKSRATLSGCSKHLQQLVHSITTTITVNDIRDLESLVKGDWPCLAVVIVAGVLWWKEPAWPEHGNLQLLAALNLCDTLALQQQRLWWLQSQTSTSKGMSQTFPACSAAKYQRSDSSLMSWYSG